MPRRPIFLVWLHWCHSLATFAFQPCSYHTSLISSCSSLSGAVEFQLGLLKLGYTCSFCLWLCLLEAASRWSQDFLAHSFPLSSPEPHLPFDTCGWSLFSHTHTHPPTPLTWLFFRSEIFKDSISHKNAGKGPHRSVDQLIGINLNPRLPVSHR